MRANSISQASAGEQQRLPVNPRRKKVPPEARKRVVRACNACNVRRVKCTGGEPCQRCEKVNRECVYSVPEPDKTGLQIENEQLRERCAALERRLQEERSYAPEPQLTNCLTPFANCRSPPSPTSDQEDSESEGRMLSDDHGTFRYHGVTSGSAFLENLKLFMRTLVPLAFDPQSEDGFSFLASIGKYQTFDSRPLPDPVVDSLWLPTPSDMAVMLAQFRFYLQDGDGNTPSGGIYWWGDFNNPPPIVSSTAALMTTDDSHRSLAFYHVCFALTTTFGNGLLRYSETSTGESYFQRARVLIGNPLDTVRFTLSDIPVLAMMAFYLIEVNRRDAAYMYVSLAIHIAIIHGAFRKCADEASKRKFWTIYILDRWLSLLMGRPPTIVDEAIRLDLPCDGTPDMPPCAGLRAHVELSKISGFVVCETFKIAPRKRNGRSSTISIGKALDMLKEWREQIPPSLQMPHDLNHPDPACCILHMEYYQLIVLTTRPMFFAAVKQAVAQRVVRSPLLVKSTTEDHQVQACAAAARSNMLLARRLVSSKRRLLQAGLHFVFNAAVVLLLNQLMTIAQRVCSTFGSHNTSPGATSEESDWLDIDFAMDTFREEAKIGTNYQRDCFQVLRDLRMLLDRYLTWSRITEPEQLSVHDQFSRVQLEGVPSCASEAVYGDMLQWIQSDVHDSLFI